MTDVPQAVLDAFCRHRVWVVGTHVDPDPDAIGSQVAALDLLEQLGCEAHARNHSPRPALAAFQDPQQRVHHLGEGLPFPEQATAALILDVSTIDRVGQVWPEITARGLFTVCIDHHIAPDVDAFDLLWHDTSAAATGQLVTALYERAGLCPPPAVAAALYGALLFDTGNLRFRNTSPQALRCAARLADWGAVPAEVYDALYGEKSIEQVRLHGLALCGMRLVNDGRVCVMRVTRAMLKETGARPEDVAGLVDLPREVRTVEMILLLVEGDNGTIRASLRAKGTLRADTICRQFGGGGHPRAAGATLPAPIEEAERRLLEAIVMATGK